MKRKTKSRGKLSCLPVTLVKVKFRFTRQNHEIIDIGKMGKMGVHMNENG